MRGVAKVQFCRRLCFTCRAGRATIFAGPSLRDQSQNQKICPPTARAFDWLCTNASHFAGSPSRGSVQPNTSSGVVPATKWELILPTRICLRLVFGYCSSASSRLSLLNSLHLVIRNAAYLIPTNRNSQILGSIVRTSLRQPPPLSYQ